ncbi:MAG: L-carnitine dehydrogenase [Kiloniellales bacterium]|nr:L-carnitine dehydrogenase [Kiloniellales bacterium]
MTNEFRREVKSVGLVGTGVIGSGWAARCLAQGLDVVASDPAPGAEARLRAAVENAWPSLEKLGLSAGADPGRLRFEPEMEKAFDAVDFLQESAPEREDVKRDLLSCLDKIVPKDVIIGSSTSYLMPSVLQADCEHGERIVVGHPFNPVYLLPLVEVVGGEKTSPEAVAAARDIYKGLGMHPLVLRKEVEGFIADRLMEAVFRESLHLLDKNVASTGEIDDAIIYGFGLRWAFMGVFLTFHLAGGDQGMRHFMSQFGPTLKLPYCEMEAPELTEELLDKICEGSEEQAGGRSVKELERLRNSCLIDIMRALQAYGIGAGQVLAERDAATSRRTV